MCVRACVYVCEQALILQVIKHTHNKDISRKADSVGDINEACGSTDHQAIVLVLEECCLLGSSSMALSSVVTPFSSATAIIHS